MEKRFSNGFQLLGTYVFSKSIDDSSVACGCTTWLGGATSLQDPNRRYLERSVSQFDIPHVFQFSYVYQFPFGHGKRWGGSMNPVVDAVVGGWQTNGIWRFDNGMPLALSVSNSRALPTYGAQRPNLLNALQRNDGADWLNQYFANPQDAVTPAPFTVGNAPREISTARAPGTATTALCHSSSSSRWRGCVKARCWNSAQRPSTLSIIRSSSTQPGSGIIRIREGNLTGELAATGATRIKTVLLTLVYARSTLYFDPSQSGLRWVNNLRYRPPSCSGIVRGEECVD